MEVKVMGGRARFVKMLVVDVDLVLFLFTYIFEREHCDSAERYNLQVHSQTLSKVPSWYSIFS